jgi:hypothetical protein
MKTKILSTIPALALAASIALFPFSTHGAESPSELLEKGIYNEETKGDVDLAITIYQALIAEAKSGQSLAAQAQFRLGQCFLKKGRGVDAVAAFEKLIRDFPNEKELVAKAREHLPTEIALGPVPWVDGERQQLTLTLDSGLVIGIMELRADLVESDGENVWRVGRRMTGGGEMVSSVHVEPETFKPLTSYWKHTLIGEASAVFKDDEVEIKTAAAKEPKTVRPDKTVYDNEEFMHLIRRLPLEVGYKTTIPTITTLGGGTVLQVGLEVTAKETLDVPVGKIACFKVPLNIGQTLWISDDAHRYVVKFEGGGATGSLASISQRKAGQPVQFRDDQLGVSLTAPADWIIHRRKANKGKKEILTLLDPGADMEGAELFLIPTDSLSVTARQSSRAWAETEFKENAVKELKDAKIRPDSWKNYTVSGRPGVSFVIDYIQSEKPRVGFALFVLGTKTSEEFNMTCAPEKLDALKAAFEGILASYKMTK